MSDEDGKGRAGYLLLKDAPDGTAGRWHVVCVCVWVGVCVCVCVCVCVRVYSIHALVHMCECE